MYRPAVDGETQVLCGPRAVIGRLLRLSVGQELIFDVRVMLA